MVCQIKLVIYSGLWYNLTMERGGELMEIASIVENIITLGFPVVACIIMGWYVKDQTDKNNNRIDQMQMNHMLEMKEVTTAINNNTIALTKLCTIVERGE